MTTLLTTDDVQRLINVDKSTIYRMADDGRLPAVKVGRQWRFPASAVASLLGEGVTALAHSSPTRGRHRLRDLLAPEAAQAIAALVGDLFGVMAVVAEMDGTALTPVANPCGYFDVIESQPGATDRCSEGWRRLGSETDLEPKFLPTHFGFACARTYIRAGNELIGMVIVGGVAPEGGIDDTTLEQVAGETGIDLEQLKAARSELYALDAEARDWVLRMLPRISDLISRLASARSELLNKLDAVSELAATEVQPRSTP